MPRKPSFVRLLQVQPSLGAQLTREEFAEARRLAVVLTVTLPAGNWEAAALARRFGPGGAFGCLIVDGIVAHDLLFAGRTATHLLGRGDIIAPAVPTSRHLPLRMLYGVADPTRVALLDDGFAAVVRRWPAIGEALLGQAEL